MFIFSCFVEILSLFAFRHSHFQSLCGLFAPVLCYFFFFKLFYRKSLWFFCISFCHFMSPRCHFVIFDVGFCPFLVILCLIVIIFVHVFSQLASLCSFKIILHSPLVSVELSDRRYLPQRYAAAASSCFLWVTCSFVFRWEPSGFGKAESVCRELKRAAAEIRRRTSQNKTISERRELFLARLSLRL